MLTDSELYIIIVYCMDMWQQSTAVEVLNKVVQVMALLCYMNDLQQSSREFPDPAGPLSLSLSLSVIEEGRY